MDYELRDGIRRTKQSAKEALGIYLKERRWTSFFTVTFASPQRFSLTAVSKTAKAIHRFEHDYFCYDAHGAAVYGGVSRAFIAAERHESGLFHCHGLYFHPDADSSSGLKRVGIQAETDVCRSLKVRFDDLGWSRAERIKSERACAYVAKYLLKDETSEWDFLGDAFTWNRPIDKALPCGIAMQTGLLSSENTY